MGAALLACTDLTPVEFRCVCGRRGHGSPDSVPHLLP